MRVYEVHFLDVRGRPETIHISGSRVEATASAREWSAIVGETILRSITIMAANHGLVANVDTTERFVDGETSASFVFGGDDAFRF